MLLWVWIAVAVLAVVVLGSLAYNVLGAVQRFTREQRALEREVLPVLAQLQETAERAAAARAQHAGDEPDQPGPLPRS